MFQDTRPADLRDVDGSDPWGPFRVGNPAEIVALLRQLRDGSVTLTISTPTGDAMGTTVWAVDIQSERVTFTAEESHPHLQGLVAADEAVAVCYLDAVKLQFDLEDLLLVRSARACALQARLPRSVYRFQRRSAFRVRTLERHSPTARLRHPAIPDMQLALRVLDVSIGGCALFLPHSVPTIEPGVVVRSTHVELDADTRFTTALAIHHAGSISANERGLRLGCEFTELDGNAARSLQRYIDQTQKRRRLLSFD